MSILLVLALAYIQNIAFTMVGRARNRNHIGYNAVMSVFSNGIWFLTMQQLVVSQMSAWLLFPYVVGTVLGSMTGAAASARIEKWLGASV